MITVRLNDQVLVSLSTEGNHILKKHYDDMNSTLKELTGKLPSPLHTPQCDPKSGYIQMTMWEVVELFGPHTHVGGEVLFELKIPEAKDGN